MDFEEALWCINKVRANPKFELTAWEDNFLESIKQFIEHSDKGYLSEKQSAVLERLRNRCV